MTLHLLDYSCYTTLAIITASPPVETNDFISCCSGVGCYQAVQTKKNKKKTDRLYNSGG